MPSPAAAVPRGVIDHTQPRRVTLQYTFLEQMPHFDTEDCFQKQRTHSFSSIRTQIRQQVPPILNSEIKIRN